MRAIIALGGFGVLFFVLSGVAHAVEAPQHAHWSFHEMGLIPVQSGGRMKPLDTFARELTLFETGSRSFEGWGAVDLLSSWLAFPAVWEEKPFIQITREDVRRQLNLDDKRTRFSPHELMTNSALGQYAQRMGGRPETKEEKADLRQQELTRVLERLGVFRDVIAGNAWLVVPTAPPAAWLSLAAPQSQAGPIRMKFLEMFKAYMGTSEKDFQAAVGNVRATVESSIPGWSAGYRRTIAAESFYNCARPFFYAWVIYLLAALTWLFAGAPGRPGVRKLALGMTALAWIIHLSGIALRCYIAGRPPVTNMYESVIWVSFGVVFFAGILYAIQRQPITLLVACVLATLGLIAGDSAPAVMDPGIHPLVPVLRSNYWLTIHVLTITLGYAAFALTFGLAEASLIHFLRRAIEKKALPERDRKIAELNQLTYRAMQFGTVLLAAGTILGGIWADYSWGRFWGWDPKEVWALIALLSYVVILHARFTGWVGQFGFTVWTVSSFLSVIMAWYGVNFVLGVGLHSYGFSTGGRGTVAAFVGMEILFVLFVVLMHRRAAAVNAAK